MKKSGFTLLAVTALTLGILAPAHRALAQDGDVDPINDLAALLLPESSDGATGKLYTLPNLQSQVIEALHAIPVGPNEYQTDVSGKTITFSPIPVPFPPIYLPPGELICQTGMVRVYRNATCLMTSWGLSYACTPYFGNWANADSLPVSKCKRGTGLCVEVNKVAFIRRIYYDNQCTQLLGFQTSSDFSCN
jgi:hypothetical protein